MLRGSGVEVLRGSGVEKLRPLISSTEPLQHQCFDPHLVQTPLGIETWCEHWTPSQTEDMPTIEKKRRNFHDLQW